MGAVDKKFFTWWNTILNLSIHIQNKVYKLKIEKCFSKLLKTAMKFYQVMQVHVVIRSPEPTIINFLSLSVSLNTRITLSWKLKQVSEKKENQNFHIVKVIWMYW